MRKRDLKRDFVCTHRCLCRLQKWRACHLTYYSTEIYHDEIITLSAPLSHFSLTFVIFQLHPSTNFSSSSVKGESEGETNLTNHHNGTFLSDCDSAAFPLLIIARLSTDSSSPRCRKERTNTGLICDSPEPYHDEIIFPQP